ncbi:hypothetical protein [Rubritalea tangerina]|uniref:hypothetical protein n=1 Tax=Rubritalea tangerina TaxID=430798 RepID=UPI003617A208
MKSDADSRIMLTIESSNVEAEQTEIVINEQDSSRLKELLESLDEVKICVDSRAKEASPLISRSHGSANLEYLDNGKLFYLQKDLSIDGYLLNRGDREEVYSIIRKYTLHYD